jgi:hypothetical protein
VQSGSNALGVILGNGWYNQHTREAWDFDLAPWRDSPTLRCQLEITYAGGGRDVIVSGSDWKFAFGPIVFDGVHNGETYDARLELGNWSVAGFRDQDWKAPFVVAGPQGKLSSQIMPPIRIITHLKPKSRHEAAAGRIRVRPRAEHDRLGPLQRLGAGGGGGCAAVRRAAAPRRLARPEGAEPLYPDRRDADQPLPAQRGAGGALAPAVHLPRFPVRGGERELAGRADPQLRGRRGAHRPGEDRLLQLLQRRVQPAAAQHPLVFPGQLPRLPNRLPAPREDGLDRRRPAGGRGGPLQLRRYHRLPEVAGRLSGRAAAQRAGSGHHPHQRLGLHLGQRGGIGKEGTGRSGRGPC